MQDSQHIVADVRRVASSQGVILFDAKLLPHASLALCDADAWPEAQPLSGRGGRGGATLLHGPFGAGILRHFRRGGLIGRWVRNRYLFLGESRTRSVREFRLLVELVERGLPVPQPVLAGWRRQGAFYSADIVTRQVTGARTLAEHLDAQHEDLPWRRIGGTVAQFHHEGVFHADLNAHNILLDEAGKIWLIDFDRGRLRRPRLSWQNANLQRLRRSLVKLGGFDESGWTALIEAYRTTMAALLAAETRT